MGKGCFSGIGRHNRGAQELSLGPKCNGINTILHELMHAIGKYSKKILH